MLTYLFRAIIFMATSNLQFSTAVLGLFIVNDTFFIVFYLVAKVSVYIYLFFMFIYLCLYIIILYIIYIIYSTYYMSQSVIW